MTLDEELDKLVGIRDSCLVTRSKRLHASSTPSTCCATPSTRIRHSNVIAWLLDPGGTHGIGRGFLEWFLRRARVPVKMPDNIVCGTAGSGCGWSGSCNYVDVTIFLESHHGRHIVAVENKPGRALPEHYEQARAHLKRLRPKYPGHETHGVLLSSSREGIKEEDKIAHVSWRMSARG